MDEKNCELLFEYLRSILYDTKIQSLDISSLDEPYQKLGMGLQYLEKAVGELKSYSLDLSKGNLSIEPPPRDNFLCENLKNIHANLNHLTWQAKQVAKGDYSQNVSFLGEFSEAFNTMTQQLRERELHLRQEAIFEKTHASIVDNYNQLLSRLISQSREEIFVTGIDGKKILYYNKGSDEILARREIYRLCLAFVEDKTGDNASSDSFEWEWETEDSSQHYYKIITILMEWQGEKAYAHIIYEITKDRVLQQQLETKANQDTLTGIGNRRYFHEQAEHLLRTNSSLIFCYCDLDHLKFINDKYGHEEGDTYLKSFVSIANQYLRTNDIFARLGGDEFCIILVNCPYDTARKKIKMIQEIFCSGQQKYPRNFSCGIVEIPKDHTDLSITDIIRHADNEMYLEKKEHKSREN